MGTGIRPTGTNPTHVVWSLSPGSRIEMACQQDGWYHLADGSGWVPSRYVQAHDWVRYC
ncbi:hypothetical protein OTB20_08960 [Streptomyces sp. H27-H1]|uniref:hypothetical protein n=1 Tax=Streptomyces sp. H27-H1 TaxID=2996461 RepID=UPI00226F7922|nr:hypothetical protein [Streptomyces sp. H27-H1]MCY0926333.1 hypothetical protein [Streptomyces sp. H27-H1]